MAHINTDVKCFQSQKNKMPTLHNNTKQHKIRASALLHCQPRTGYLRKKKMNGKKNASPFFPHLPSHACWDMLTAAWCWLHQCSLNSAKCSTFSAKGKKVIVQRNKEGKLYILNQTEKHLKHQHKLTIAALLHASLKTGKKKEQCFSPSAMHMLSTPIFPLYSWRFSLTLGNCSMIIWKILAKTFYLHQCTLSTSCC